MALADLGTEIFEGLEVDLKKEAFLKNPPFSSWFRSEGSKQRLEGILGEAMTEVRSYISPKAATRILRRGETDIAAYSPPGELLKSELLAIGVVTVGARAGRGAHRSSLYEELVVDALENVALIEAESKVVMRLKAMADAEGLRTTRMIPPGSGRINWGTENQQFIFKNLDAARIGVVLTPSFVMLPRKSVSFVMGMGRDIEQAKDLFSCAGCRRLDCPYRV